MDWVEFTCAVLLIGAAVIAIMIIASKFIKDHPANKVERVNLNNQSTQQFCWTCKELRPKYKMFNTVKCLWCEVSDDEAINDWKRETQHDIKVGIIKEDA